MKLANGFQFLIIGGAPAVLGPQHVTSCKEIVVMGLERPRRYKGIAPDGARNSFWVCAAYKDIAPDGAETGHAATKALTGPGLENRSVICGCSPVRGEIFVATGA